MKTKILNIISVLLILIMIGGGIVLVIITKKNKETSILEFKNEITASKKIEVKEAEPTTVKGVISYIDNDKNMVEYPYEVTDKEPYSQYINKIINLYSDSQYIKLGDFKINNISFNMGTINVDLSKAAMDSTFTDVYIQNDFIDSLVKSLLAIENRKYNDVQFKIDGEVVDFAFGGTIITSSPLKR